LCQKNKSKVTEWTENSRRKYKDEKAVKKIRAERIKGNRGRERERRRRSKGKI